MVGFRHHKTPLFARDTFAACFENTPKNSASQQNSRKCILILKAENGFFSKPKKNEPIFLNLLR